MIIHILSKLHEISLENKINLWLHIHGKRDAMMGLGDIIQLWATFLPLGSL